MDYIPEEIVACTLSFVERKYLLSVRLTCKRFLKISVNNYDPSSDKNFAIRTSCSHNLLDSVKSLLRDRRVDPTSHDDYCICIASGKGYLEIVKELLKNRSVDPSKGIYAACKNGQSDVLRLLMEDVRCDPNSHGACHLAAASSAGHKDIVKILLEDGRVFESENLDNAFMIAAQKDDTGPVKLMLSDRRYLPAVGCLDLALCKAACTEDMELMEKVLSFKGVNLEDEKHSAIQAACACGKLLSVKRLVATGMKIKTREFKLLMNIASEKKHTQVRDFLLKEARKNVLNEALECQLIHLKKKKK
jgi:ankyrin repeat protein